ncbi:Nif3-like dinuclear metal center hexameric protein [Ferruginibacter paludis]|uniref:Nif3-like dinuclear metal center hexameric protein n=1 Tax=Ferruginibacter paludis TaxID=1310417 RepID=UPI0025B5FEAD|nr:Nif3-like dinuclear metal center hexameric protein [Ferruginibacter paludis]MDN3657907.1 Nif3-like dinuclear metal center hexameric protein [Ferruginibacter paludis]
MKQLSDQYKKTNYSRKSFLSDTVKLAGGISLLSVNNFAMAATAGASLKEYTVQEIMDLILKEVPGAPFKETVDTLKSGSGDQKVAGIITTMFATIDVIHAAVKRNANFIIAHEPTFYNHTDNKTQVKDNTIVEQKATLLTKHNITVWRFHDYCHALQPDAISYGVAKNSGWLPYYKQGEKLLELPAIKFAALIQHLKKSLGIAHVRVIGDPQQNCQRIALLPGAWGGDRQMAAVLQDKPDVLIIGEASEWETVEFIRDGRLLGSKTALVVLGHSVSEEPGMEWVAQWLQPMLPGIPITHIASGDPFTWM